jgi:hypothetical protein
MIDTKALAERILANIEDDDPTYLKTGFTRMSTTRRWRVVSDINGVLDEALRVGI